MTAAGDDAGDPPRPRATPDPPPQHLGLVPRWMSGTPLWVRCVVAAIAFAGLSVILRDDMSTEHVAMRTVIGAVLGVGYALAFAWLRRRGQRPRGPEGVSNWRLSVLLRQDSAPDDPQERAALARTLERARSLRWRIINGGMVVVGASFALFSIAFSAAVWDWDLFIATATVYPLISLYLFFVTRRQSRRWHSLREQLRDDDPPPPQPDRAGA